MLYIGSYQGVVRVHAGLWTDLSRFFQWRGLLHVWTSCCIFGNYDHQGFLMMFPLLEGPTYLYSIYSGLTVSICFESLYQVF